MSINDRLMWKAGDVEVTHPGDGPVLLDFREKDCVPRTMSSITIEQRVKNIEANKPHLSITNDRVLLVKKAPSITSDYNPEGINQYTYAGGSGKMNSPAGEKKAKEKEASAKRVALVTSAVEQEAVRQGLKGAVKISTKTDKFTLNGEEFESAGQFDKSNGRITIFPKAFAAGRSDAELADRVKQVVAHEVGHKIFEKAYTDAMFSNKGGFAEHMDRNMKVLAAKDGVTQYSREHWQAYNAHIAKHGANNPKEQIFKNILERRALHETFAEVHALATHTSKGSFEKQVSPEWKAVYRDIMAKSKLGAKEKL